MDGRPTRKRRRNHQHRNIGSSSICSSRFIQVIVSASTGTQNSAPPRRSSASDTYAGFHGFPPKHRPTISRTSWSQSHFNYHGSRALEGCDLICSSGRREFPEIAPCDHAGCFSGLLKLKITIFLGGFPGHRARAEIWGPPLEPDQKEAPDFALLLKRQSALPGTDPTLSTRGLWRNR
jgi:hypothetical protein